MMPSMRTGGASRAGTRGQSSVTGVCGSGRSTPRVLAPGSPVLGFASRVQARSVSSLVETRQVVDSAAHHEPSNSTTHATELATEQKHELYSWTRQWWPVAAVEELDETRPHSITLLGKDLVLWRDGSKVWRCFEDYCPHRLAPLSEGRVEKDGTLLCTYHAWRFDGSGACTHIPQARDKEQEALALRSPKSCAVAHPTMEAQGLIWVWGEGAMGAADLGVAERAAASAPRLIPEIEELEIAPDGKGRIKKTAWRSTELPYGHDYFLENVTDPAHVVVSHHGITGNRYTDPKAIEFTPVRGMSMDNGFKFAVSNVIKNGSTVSTTDYLPPCLVRIESQFPNGAKSLLVLYTAPTRPGHAKHMGCQVLTAGPDGKLPPGLGFFAMPMPTWLLHVLGAGFLHQDAVFLHWQEKIAATGKFREQRAVEKYFTPTSADKMVLTLRQWFERHAPEGIPFEGAYKGAPLPPIERDPQKLFDTWHAHTKNCKQCKAALANLQTARVVAAAVGVLAALQAAVITASASAAKAAALAATAAAAAAAASTATAAGPIAAAAATSAAFSAPPLAAVGCGAVALLAVGLAVMLTKLISLFYVFPYSHADNH